MANSNSTITIIPETRLCKVGDRVSKGENS